eukprot:scaffold6255_cov118-Cylindrotheca_fusiformis.AAC.2
MKNGTFVFVVLAGVKHFLTPPPMYGAVVALNSGWKGASRWPKEQKFVVTRLPKKGRIARAQNLVLYIW